MNILTIKEKIPNFISQYTVRSKKLSNKNFLYFLLLLLLLLLLATVTYNQVQSYRVNLLQLCEQIIKTAKCHCCVFMTLDHSIREVNYSTR